MRSSLRCMSRTNEVFTPLDISPPPACSLYPLPPFAMWPAFPASDYYGPSAPTRQQQPARQCLHRQHAQQARGAGIGLSISVDLQPSLGGDDRIEYLLDGKVTTEAIAQGIQDMQIEYGIDRSGDGYADEYVAGPTVDEMDRVITIRWNE